MSEEELIETLRAFEKNRVEQLEEPARNLFYAIMKIAGERDRLNNIIKEVRNRTIKIIANSGLDFMYRQAYKDILEILDKGSDKEWVKN